MLNFFIYFCNRIKEILFKVIIMNEKVGHKEVTSVRNNVIHKFWETQPVPSLNDKVKEYGLVCPDKFIKDRKITEYSLPAEFEWYTMNPDSMTDLTDVAKFISANYLEDDDGSFRFDYSPDFLKWALVPRGQKDTNLCVIVRVKKNKKIVGFISGVMVNMKVGCDIKHMADVDFLCVHPNLRNKSLASVLIKEITRRIVYRYDVSQAIYSGSKYLPKPISYVKYYHRHLNVIKLVDVGFADKSEYYKLLSNHYKLPDDFTLNNFRKMEIKDAEQSFVLLNNYMQKYTCYPVFSFEEFKHWFIGNDFVSSYVTTDYQDNVVDMISYFKLTHKVLIKSKYNTINTACVYYYTCCNHSLVELGMNMLIMAQREGIDVVNITDIMDNMDMINNLKFVPGSGKLYYYMFNWKCPEMPPNQLGKCVF